MKIELTYEQGIQVVAEELLAAIKDAKGLYKEDAPALLTHLVATAKFYHPCSEWPMIEELAYG